MIFGGLILEVMKEYFSDIHWRVKHIDFFNQRLNTIVESDNVRVYEKFRIQEMILYYDLDEETNQTTNNYIVEHELFYEIDSNLHTTLQREEYREDPRIEPRQLEPRVEIKIEEGGPNKIFVENHLMNQIIRSVKKGVMTRNKVS